MWTIKMPCGLIMRGYKGETRKAAWESILVGFNLPLTHKLILEHLSYLKKAGYKAVKILKRLDG